jgi:hypothetical protein
MMPEAGATHSTLGHVKGAWNTKSSVLHTVEMLA